MTLLLQYETHAVTADNAAGVMSGWNDPVLSPIGAAAARDLGARHRDDLVAAVYTSDLRRAQQTAELAFQHTGIPIVIDARLRECNFGDLNGAPLPVVEAARPDHLRMPFPNGESFTAVLTRTSALLTELSTRHDGERVLIIAHSANKWCLDVLVHGASLAELIAAPFQWKPGWSYQVPTDWRERASVAAAG